jgi:Protein of unknown function (DUF1360)
MNTPFIDCILLILAGFRLVRLLVFDRIFEPLRDWFAMRKSSDNYLPSFFIRIRQFIGAMLQCYWCAGIWSAALICAIYLWLPPLHPFLLLLAVAGGAAILESLIPEE